MWTLTLTLTLTWVGPRTSFRSLKIIYGCLQLYLWNRFSQNKPKLWKFTRILLGRQIPWILFHRLSAFYVVLVIANHAILRKFWTPKNLSEEGFQLFSCLNRLTQKKLKLSKIDSTVPNWKLIFLKKGLQLAIFIQPPFILFCPLYLV